MQTEGGRQKIQQCLPKKSFISGCPNFSKGIFVAENVQVMSIWNCGRAAPFSSIGLKTEAPDLGFSLFVGLDVVLYEASDNYCWRTLTIIVGGCCSCCPCSGAGAGAGCSAVQLCGHVFQAS